MASGFLFMLCISSAQRSGINQKPLRIIWVMPPWVWKIPCVHRSPSDPIDTCLEDLHNEDMGTCVPEATQILPWSWGLNIGPHARASTFPTKLYPQPSCFEDGVSLSFPGKP